MAAVSVPRPWVLFASCTQLPFVVSGYMGNAVMKARKNCDVPYPNLYATPGFHKQADEFNRVQRGHQSYFESYTNVAAMCLVGGLKHPLLAAVASVAFSVGSVFFQIGYADTTLDVATARYKKGGGVKWIGVFLGMYTMVSAAGSMNGWW